MPKISQYPVITTLNGQELILMDNGNPQNRQTVTATTSTFANAIGSIIGNIFSATQAGFVPASGGGTGTTIRADGTWTSSFTGTWTFGAVNTVTLTATTGNFTNVSATATVSAATLSATTGNITTVNSSIVNASTQMTVGPGNTPVRDSATGDILYYAITSTETALGITPSSYVYPPGNVLRYGADPSGVASSGAAFQSAVRSGAAGFAPRGTYLLDGSTAIAIPLAAALTCVPGTAFLNVTANAGVTNVTLSLFQLANNSTISGFVIQYPNQTLTDNVSAIVQYPPTFTINAFNNTSYGGFCQITDIVSNGAYIFCDVEGSFHECLWQNCISYGTLYRGMLFQGNCQMGDTSRAVNCQFVMTGTQGFNNGPVSNWCQQNSVGVSAVCTGSNRIDGFMLSNFNVIGGLIAYDISSFCWFQGANVGADSCVQAIFANGTGSQVYFDELWVSTQLAALPFAGFPAIHVGPSGLTIVRINNAEINMGTSGSQNPIFVEGGINEFSSVRFFTSLGGFAPVVWNTLGDVSINNCTIETEGGSTNGQIRPVTWRDCVVGSSGGLGSATPTFIIDGIQAPQSEAGLQSLTNFSMATWSGGSPTGWTVTSGANNTNFINNLTPITGQQGIQFGGSGVGGPYVVSYSLPAASYDVFGFFLFQCAIQVSTPTASPATLFSIYMYDGVSSNVYINDTAWAGAEGVLLSIPNGNPYLLSVVLPVPRGEAGNTGATFALVCNQQTSSNLRIQLSSLQLWGCAPPRSQTGVEYWGAQTAGFPRDRQQGQQRFLLRNAIPTAGAWEYQDTAYNENTPSAGTIEWRCTLAGTPGTWTGLTIP